MPPRLKRFLLNPFVLLLLLIITLMLIDKLLGVLRFDEAAYYQLYTAGLLPPAAFNDLLEEFWFAETIAVPLLPLLLLIVKWKTRAKLHLMPWVIAAAVMLFGIGVRVQGIQSDYQAYKMRTMYGGFNLAYEVHIGASYYGSPGREIDIMLESVVPYFLRAQIPIALALGAGYAGSIGYKRLRNKL